MKNTIEKTRPQAAKFFISKQKYLFLLFSLVANFSFAQPSMTHLDHHSKTKHKNHTMQMHGMYGLYPMTREASGTSWEPDSSPMLGIMKMTQNDWMLMLHAYINFIYDDQGGPRGDEKTFSESMLMLMAQKDLSVGTFGLRSMLSLDPAMGKSGYPLLFQTGETADGKTPLIDRQHPHDFFMELAPTYSLPLSAHSSLFIYGGLPGEPALGPPVFMNRFSAMDNPEAPLSHHWLDATHISYGVITLGYILNSFKIEGSVFNGHEPDQYRWNIESPELNSYSARVSYNPSSDWSLQISSGHLQAPEQLQPEVNTTRSTASAIYNKPFCVDDNWATTFAWGQDANHPGHTLNAYLVESEIVLNKTHTFFGRAERLQEDELFADDTQNNPFFVAQNPALLTDIFFVNKLSLGYIVDFWHNDDLFLGVGGLGSVYAIPTAMQVAYGSHPTSFMFFARVRTA